LIDLHQFQNIPENEIKSSGYVVDTLEAAVWCMINTSSYAECVLKAVNLGDDTDTVAAIAGGLAGLYYGYDNIPTEWLNVIQKREWIEKLLETSFQWTTGQENN
jgi:ADP-ribosylglycohydrolase